MRRRQSGAIVALAISAGFLAACSSDNSAGSQLSQSVPPSSQQQKTSASPTLTASKLQPPSQDNNRFNGERPKVVVDPCTWISDDAVARIGFDPSTRKRGNDIVGEYVFLTCDFSTPERTLQLDSGNVTLDEVKRKYDGKTQPLNISGREAVMTHKTNADECSLDMRTNAGYLGLSFIVHTPGKSKGINSCDDIVEAATILEPSIGKEN